MALARAPKSKGQSSILSYLLTENYLLVDQTTFQQSKEFSRVGVELCIFRRYANSDLCASLDRKKGSVKQMSCDMKFQEIQVIM